jgi:FkbM family methyltransferase
LLAHWCRDTLRCPVAATPDLAFDVGMHDASDTAYYLRSGYRVVAVEANPELVQRARQRFAAEIAQRRLTVVWVGIGAGEDESSFWVCDDHSEWSSFDRSVASRNNCRHHEVRVPVRSLDKILEEHGVPRYCKIDIEGHDHLCVEAITPESRPDFLSVELSRGRLLERLSGLGYDRFKVVHQVSFCPVARRLQRLKERLGNQRVALALERAHGLMRGSLFDRGWYFRIGSSGPLPDRTPGRWHGVAEVETTIAELRGARARSAISRGEWFDIHATTAAQAVRA